MKKIALLGQPNSGKSTVFNALTGSRQHVGNWPGKTVEKSEGKFTYGNETLLNATYMGQNSIADVAFHGNVVATDVNALSAVMGSMITKPEALAFIFACTFNIPCLMALNTTLKESHSLKWTAIIAGFYAGSALILSCIVYHIALLIF